MHLTHTLSLSLHHRVIPKDIGRVFVIGGSSAFQVWRHAALLVPRVALVISPAQGCRPSLSRQEALAHDQCTDVHLTTVYGDGIECDTTIPMPDRTVFQPLDGASVEVGWRTSSVGSGTRRRENAGIHCSRLTFQRVKEGELEYEIEHLQRRTA